MKQRGDERVGVSIIIACEAVRSTTDSQKGYLDSGAPGGRISLYCPYHQRNP